MAVSTLLRRVGRLLTNPSEGDQLVFIGKGDRKPPKQVDMGNSGLMGPGADRLRRGLELVRQRLGRASRPDQLYHLAAELHWIAWVSLWHREHLLYPQIIRCPPNRVNSTPENARGSPECVW